MISSLKFILNTQLKRPGIHKTIRGFTLIELLVAMILAVLILTPLLTFMVNILDTDRKEQAKAATEQEIKSALDYISRDLEQAVYIYDADGLTRNSNTTDVTQSGIKDQIPPAAPAIGGCESSNASNCQPILVFWKREFITNSVGVSSPTDSQTDDDFVYALVAYYLITNPNSSSSTWSPSARIGRFEIRGNVNAANANTAGTSCDPGFNPPPLAQTFSGAALKDKMDQWTNSLGKQCSSSVPSSATYTQEIYTLVDYISTSGPAISCASGQQGIGSNTSGFYACVNAGNVLSQLYLRGNAFVRLNNNNNTPYTSSIASYFPAASVQVQGRGFLLVQ